MEDFLGFRFGNIHTKDLHLTVVSSSNRYQKNLLPTPTDYTVDVPGGNGKYYFGQTFQPREIKVNIAFEDIDEPTWRCMAQIFSTDHLRDLVFDENPYKTYRAKLKSAPDLKFVCFKDRNTQERIYKGEGTLTFICYHPLAYCFNKYIVRAADFYKCTQPQSIINKDSIKVNPYKEQSKPRMLTGLIKDHYNVKDNMATPWKGGYPTIDQVQWGELYFNEEHENNYNKDCDNEQSNPQPENKLIIDVRGYWDNIPKWQTTAKLLTTPTLDYEQELIYIPQYSKINYYNMETGLNKQNGLIGSRLLVYNPGDVPIDFELKLGNLSSNFRQNLNDTLFRISRLNVQRLTIEQAVDWTGLLPQREEDQEQYKYGTKYFKIIEPPLEKRAMSEQELDDDYDPTYRELGFSHPTHCYIVEPIPQEHLGYFIKLFYWQSNLFFNKLGEATQEGEINFTNLRHIFNHEQGIEFANRYKEMRELCINDDERNQLYWETLKLAILERYKELNDELPDKYKIFNDNFTYEDFVYNYFYNPPEYIRQAEDLDYKEFLFNISRLPQYYTFDYFDISNENFDKIEKGTCGCDIQPVDDSHRPTLPLILDSEKRLLYNIKEPEWENTKEFFNEYPEEEKNLFNFKPSKLILNDNIKHGHWFQLPPGWSLIDISPVVDEALWGGKRWLDARPFDWGYSGDDTEERRAYFNKIYKAAATKYLSQTWPIQMFEKYKDEPLEDGAESNKRKEYVNQITEDQKREWLSSFTLAELEPYLQFRRWYEDEEYGDYSKTPYDLRIFSKNYNPNKTITQEELIKTIGYEINHFKTENAEYGFLKLLADYWRVNKYKINSENDEISWNNADVDDWWWYACHYIWANLPPLYWGFADLLNHAQIKYIPQYY